MPRIALDFPDDDGFHDDMTLAAARELLRSLVEDGRTCPCCGLLAKIYKHKCDSAMAATLCRMYRNGGETMFLHTVELPGDNHKVSQLSWWGLVEEELVRRPDGGRAGYWRLTSKGVKFVRQQQLITKYARIFDAAVLGYQGEQVSIIDCLGDKFNYRELMGW